MKRRSAEPTRATKSRAAKLSGVTVPKIATGMPRTTQILKMFEPRILPRTRPVSPFRAATTVVTSSGREVPRAITVKAITRSETPTRVAISEAESTTKFEPKIIPRRPIRVKRRDFPSFHFGFSFLFFSFLRPFVAIEIR